VGRRLLVAAEAPVGRKRQAEGRDPGGGEKGVVLEQLQGLEDPPLGRVHERGRGPRDVQRLRDPHRQAHVAQGRERDAEQDDETLALGLEKALHPHVCRDLVGRGGRREGEHREDAGAEGDTGRERPWGRPLETANDAHAR
jgi:hypothetical protein